MLASSCSQLEAIGGSASQQRSSIPELRIHPSTPLRQGAAPTSSVPPTSAAGEQCGGQVNGQLIAGQPLYLRRRAGKGEKDGEGVRRDSEGLLRLVRSHSEPGLGSSTDTGKSDTKISTPLTIQYLTCSCMSSSLVDFGSVGSKASIDTGKTQHHFSLPFCLFSHLIVLSKAKIQFNMFAPRGRHLSNPLRSKFRFKHWWPICPHMHVIYGNSSTMSKLAVI